MKPLDWWERVLPLVVVAIAIVFLLVCIAVASFAMLRDRSPA